MGARLRRAPLFGTKVAGAIPTVSNAFANTALVNACWHCRPSPNWCLWMYDEAKVTPP